MTRGRLSIALGTALLVGLAVLAVAEEVTWEEVDAGVQQRVNPRSGETEFRFYVALEYAEGVPCPQLTYHWQVFAVEAGEDVLLYEDQWEARWRSCQNRIVGVSSAPPEYVQSVPGARFKAKVVIEDLGNDLRYEKMLDYTVPVSVPVGIGVYAMVEEDVVMGYDLSSVSDADLESLVRILNFLEDELIQTASETAFGEFFPTYVTPDALYPAEIIVLPSLPQLVGEGATGGGFTVSYNRILLTYPVPSADAEGGVIEQVLDLEEEFVGDVLLYEGDPTDPLVPVVVFVHDAVWEVLEAAKDELAGREAE
jgi:hypothetical protein